MWIWRDGEYYYPRQQNENLDIVILYKLHGSLRWKLNKYKLIERTNEEGKSGDKDNCPKNILIYPTLYPKEQGKEPFKTIIEEFKGKMKETENCIIIGFSFRDKHIVEEFEEFIKKKKKLIIVDKLGEYNFKKFVNNEDVSKSEEGESEEEITIDQISPTISIKHKSSGELVYVIPEFLKKNNVKAILLKISELIRLDDKNAYNYENKK